MPGPRTRRLPRLLLPAVLLAAVAGIAAGVGLHLARASTPSQPAASVPALHGQAVWAAGERPARPFVLRDQDGRRVSLAALEGRTVVLAFLDPLCRQECPIEGRELADAERQVAPKQRPVLLIVSVNPRARGPAADAAARRWGISGDWHWLLGRRAQLAPVWRAYGITVIPRSGDIVHSTALYVIDRRGFERVGVLAPFLPQFLADDLRALAREQA